MLEYLAVHIWIKPIPDSLSINHLIAVHKIQGAESDPDLRGGAG